VRVPRGWVAVGPRPGVYEGCSGRWYANEFGFVLEAQWRQIDEFQTPLEYDPDETDEELMARAKCRMMALPGYTILREFNAVLPGPNLDFIRFCAAFGERKIVRWSWWDANVALPLNRAVAWWKTLCASVAPRDEDLR
jgi:hypothetical protein